MEVYTIFKKSAVHLVSLKAEISEKNIHPLPSHAFRNKWTKEMQKDGVL